MDDNDIQLVQSKLLSYLRGQVGVGEEIDEQTDLLERGVLDSLLITDLVAMIHRSFGVELTAYDISPRHLSTVAAMARLVHDKRGKMKHAA
jgi:acyl carrier protein